MRKKLLFLSAISLMLTSGALLSNKSEKQVIAEETTSLYSWDFNDGFAASGWSELDADTDGYCWSNVSAIYSGCGRDDSQCLLSASFINDIYELNTENWLFTPKITLGDYNYKLSYWMAAMDSDFPDDYKVCIGTTTTPSEMEQLYPSSGMASTPLSWENILIDIPEKYKNTDVYIAFAHIDYDQFFICLDDVSIETVNPVVIVVSGEFGSLSNIYYEEGIERGTTYSISGNTLTIDGTTITAIPDEGYKFDKWVIGDQQVTGGTIEDDVEIKALFVEASTKITLLKILKYEFTVFFKDGQKLGDYLFALENTETEKAILDFTLNEVVDDIESVLDDSEKFIKDCINEVSHLCTSIFEIIKPYLISGVDAIGTVMVTRLLMNVFSSIVQTFIL